MQGGKRVIGDFRLGGADGGEERRFSGVGQADDPASAMSLSHSRCDLGAGPAGVELARRAVGRGFETHIAETAFAAIGEDEMLADLSEIGDQGFPIPFVDLGADRHFEHHVIASAVRWLPMPCGRFWP